MWKSRGVGEISKELWETREACLLGGRLPKDILPMHAANLLLTGGILFRRRRQEFMRSGAAEAVVWTGIEELLQVLLAGRQQPPRA